VDTGELSESGISAFRNGVYILEVNDGQKQSLEIRKINSIINNKKTLLAVGFF
jgi:hypothetical protein